MSTAVAKMVGSGIVDPAFVTQNMVAAALAGAICWNLFTLLLGLPTSSSHALDRRTGRGCSHAWRVGHGETDPGLRSGLGSHGVRAVLWLCHRVFVDGADQLVCFRVTRSVATRLFKRLQLISACFMAFSHGANDAQKAMGIITLALLSAGQIPSAEVPAWVIGACAVAMGLGTAVGGWRIVRTLGMGIVKLEPVHGFAAETGAATVLLVHGAYWTAGQHDSHHHVVRHGRRRDQTAFSGAVGRDHGNSVCLDVYPAWGRLLSPRSSI